MESATRLLRPLLHLLLLALVVFIIYQFLILPFLFAKARVIHMIDPDSLLVMQGGTVQRIQLIGVDAPELAGPKSEIRQCFSAKAVKQAASFFKVNREVVLDADAVLGDTDVHGRLLRYVRLENGLLLNELLLQEGLAKEFHPEGSDYEKREQFTALADAARAEGLGLWETCGADF